MYLGVLEVIKNLRVSFGFSRGWFLYLPAVFRFPPTCWDVKKTSVVIFYEFASAYLKLFNTSGTSCLISYRKYRKQCIPWLGTHTDVMRCIHYMCCGSIMFILGLNFILLCLKSIIIHYHTPKQRNIKLNQG